MSAINPLHPAATDGFDQSDCPFEPGTLVPQSGLYEVCHKDERRTPAVLLAGELFLECRRCGGDVRYRLLRPAPHISEDPDFQPAS
jgi:hypothetical protein